MTKNAEGLLLHPSFKVEVCRDSHGRYWMEPNEIKRILKLEPDSCECIELIRKEEVVSQIRKKKINIEKLHTPLEGITMSKKEWAKEFNREIDEVLALLEGSKVVKE